jgi:hypothetical protein
MHRILFSFFKKKKTLLHSSHVVQTCFPKLAFLKIYWFLEILVSHCGLGKDISITFKGWEGGDERKEKTGI